METSVDKCLAFCQSLVISGENFFFTLSFCNETFSFNNKGLESRPCAKKKSPSQIRRELKRKSERMWKKPEAESAEKVVEAQLADLKGSTASSCKTVSKCSQCDSSFKYEDELKMHIVMYTLLLFLPLLKRSVLPITFLIWYSHQFKDKAMKRMPYHQLLLFTSAG